MNKQKKKTYLFPFALYLMNINKSIGKVVQLFCMATDVSWSSSTLRIHIAVNPHVPDGTFPKCTFHWPMAPLKRRTNLNITCETIEKTLHLSQPRLSVWSCVYCLNFPEAWLKTLFSPPRWVSGDVPFARKLPLRRSHTLQLLPLFPLGLLLWYMAAFNSRFLFL